MADTLRERLRALADNYPSRMTTQQYYELVEQAALMALDEAARTAHEFDFGLDSQAGLVRDIRALAATLDAGQA